MNNKDYLLIIIFSLLIGLLGVYEINRRQRSHKMDSLKAEISHLSAYKEKEERISKMEKAMLVCFDLSKYEAHYYSIIYDDFAIKYNIPWEIYPSIIRIESNFDPTVLSPKNAKGIAQVIEGTGKITAEKIGITYKPLSTLWNDLLCQIIGFTYLSEAIKEKGFEDGIKCYIGGLGFDAGRKDIGEYRTTVRKEYDRLSYVYKGVLYDSLVGAKK